MKGNQNSNFKIPPVATIALNRLKLELPSRLTYHGCHHSIDVIEEVVTLAKKDSLSDRDTELLVIAAAYHDSGFLFKHHQNEELASKLAETELIKDGGYQADEISEIKKCILSTKISGDFSRVALTNLSKYLMDADLGNLGRPDFFEKMELLIKETSADRKNFYKHTIKLLDNHKWLTKAAIELRQKGKEENKAKLEQLILNS